MVRGTFFATGPSKPGVAGSAGFSTSVRVPQTVPSFVTVISQRVAGNNASALKVRQLGVRGAGLCQLPLLRNTHARGVNRRGSAGHYLWSYTPEHISEHCEQPDGFTLARSDLYGRIFSDILE